ncbi:MAG: permease [Rhodocyclales bacterium GT-UBC]|nr:MAG: permease [Rhodocyclales bacterium GT-UBC]
MKNNLRFGRSRFWCVLALLLLTGCVSEAPIKQGFERKDDVVTPPVPLSALNYYPVLHRMTSAEIGRERMVLAALPANPNNQVRMAMVLGHPRGPQDLPKAIALLDAVLKSTDPAAITLQPLARLMLDGYIERQRQDIFSDKQALQLKESQRRVAELQEKIDSLADIERTLPQRPRAQRLPVSGGGR